MQRPTGTFWPGRRVTCSALVFALLVAGCAVTTKMTMSQRSSLEQRLLVRAPERAIAALDVQHFVGRVVTLELYTLTEPQTQQFATEMVSAYLREQGVHIVTEAQKAELRLKVFASIFGIEQGETLLGLPAIPTLLGFVIPELALYKEAREVEKDHAPDKQAPDDSKPQ